MTVVNRRSATGCADTAGGATPPSAAVASSDDPHCAQNRPLAAAPHRGQVRVSGWPQEEQKRASGEAGAPHAEHGAGSVGTVGL
jgi:hypothetical protein